jgi:hypothetical protein
MLAIQSPRPHAGILSYLYLARVSVRAGPALSVFRKEPNGRWIILRDANMLTGVNGGMQ